MYDTALLLVLAYTMWVIDRKQIGIEKHWYPKLVFKAIRPQLLTEQPHSQLHSDPKIKASFKNYFCKNLLTSKGRHHTKLGLLLGYSRLWRKKKHTHTKKTHHKIVQSKNKNYFFCSDAKDLLLNRHINYLRNDYRISISAETILFFNFLNLWNVI